MPDGRVVRGVRACLTRGGWVVVWQDITGVAKPVLVQPVNEYSHVPALGEVWHRKRLELVLPDGTLHVNQTGVTGCNCGMPALSALDERDTGAVVAAAVKAWS